MSWSWECISERPSDERSNGAFLELSPGQRVILPFLEHSYLVDLAKLEDPLLYHILILSGRNANTLKGQPTVEHHFQGENCLSAFAGWWTKRLLPKLWVVDISVVSHVYLWLFHALILETLWAPTEVRDSAITRRR